MLTHFRGARDQRQVALTFDDGPNPYCTPLVLDILAAKNVQASFFSIGCWAEHWSDMLQRVAAQHVVGNHSYLHENPAVDYAEAEAAIQKAINRPTAFVRVPYLTEPSAALTNWLGTRLCIGGDVVSQDWEPGRSAESIFNEVCHNPNLDNGSIIVFHDGSERLCDLRSRPRAMLEALPRIIDELQGRGYQLVGLDTMFPGVSGS